MRILETIERNETPAPPLIDDDILELVRKNRPDAIVYAVPVSGAKIITSPGDDAEWKGIAFRPDLVGSSFAWTSDNLNPASWIIGSIAMKALRFVASRVDDDGRAHFYVPDSDLIISAEWVEKDGRWNEGEIIDAGKKERQPWRRAGWFSSMEPGPFNNIPTVRRLQNVLTAATLVKNGGIDQKVPF